MKEKKKTEAGKRFDEGRAAYMIAWRDRHIEKLKESLTGYEEQARLTQALLAFTLFRAATPQDSTDGEGERVLEIPKAELSALLDAWECATEASDACYLVRFFKKGERKDASQA